MVTCKPSKFSFGSLSPQLVPTRNPRSLRVSSGAVFDGPKWNHHHHHSDASSSSSTRYSPRKSDELGHSVSKKLIKHEEEEEEAEERERKVHCEVEVVSWRERRIKAETLVQADVESVWNALTDYERLADFIPNLISSKRIPCPYPGRIWLEQRGFERALYWHIEARVVLDLREFINSDFDRELRFSMVDGDFKKFEGKWFVKCGIRSSSSILSYEVNVIPRFNFPAIFLERIIRSDLPVNLRALACRAERILEGNQASIDGSLNGKDNLLTLEFKDCLPASNFVPLTPSSSELNIKWGILGKTCSLDRQCMVDEVHLRRFDGLLENGGVHRFVVASITVKAPVREVWNVLTAYERLPEFFNSTLIPLSSKKHI